MHEAIRRRSVFATFSASRSSARPLANARADLVRVAAAIHGPQLVHAVATRRRRTYRRGRTSRLASRRAVRRSRAARRCAARSCRVSRSSDSGAGMSRSVIVGTTISTSAAASFASAYFAASDEFALEFFAEELSTVSSRMRRISFLRDFLLVILLPILDEGHRDRLDDEPPVLRERPRRARERRRPSGSTARAPGRPAWFPRVRPARRARPRSTDCHRRPQNSTRRVIIIVTPKPS